MMREVPGDTGDSERRAGHDEERPTGYPRNLPCVQYRHVQDWKGFIAVTPHGGRIRPNDKYDISCPCARPRNLHDSPVKPMASFLLTGWLYVRAKDLADRNPDQQQARTSPSDSQQVYAGDSWSAAILVALVVRGHIALSFIGMDR